VGSGVELDRLKMETVIGAGMWCHMGMRFISIGISIGVGISSRCAAHDLHKAAVQPGQVRNKPAPDGNEMTPARGSFAGSCLPSLRQETAAPH
jgi:hypothetical protein